MQVSERWLRAWCDPPLGRAALADTLTQAGIEVEGIEPLPALDAAVVLARVLAVRPHPNADRLRVCEVDAGGAGPVQVVCGAPNVRAGMYAALATVGAQLPGGLRIKASRLRGETSEGMLCSAAELALAADADGLMELPQGSPGQPLHTFLDLDDSVFHLGLTPNRGDCLSVRGLARELAALTGAPARGPALTPVPGADDSVVPVVIDAPADCPRYACRVVHNLDARAATPLWMRERLRRAGLRSLGAVIDITNYVLLELGQPLHAFDLGKLAGPAITVRRARDGETLTVLGGQTITLTDAQLVIADTAGPVALAGVIGGADSAVQPGTCDVLLESAWFAPRTVSRAARAHGLITEAALRFERGADPTAQVEALEYATSLLVDICAGQPGPVVDVTRPDDLPHAATITLDPARAARVLGVALDPSWCAQALERLGGVVTAAGDRLSVTAPAWRGDWRAPEDLVEELARLYGYAGLPAASARVAATMPAAPEQRVSARTVADMLCARGFQEAITYAFGDPDTQQRCDPQAAPVWLANPLSADLAVLRTQLWPGLMRSAAHNVNRQAARVRLFEIGRRFLARDQTRPLEQTVVAALALGSALPEQWGVPIRAVDFFDLKADLEALRPGAAGTAWRFAPCAHPALHPRHSAQLLADGQAVGVIGRLHPAIERHFDLPATYIFEVLLDAVRARTLPAYTAVDRFPSVRRDLALLVADTVGTGALRDTITAAAGPVLRECVLFDVYRGPGVDAGLCSVAFGLRLAHTERTLTDQETDAVVAKVVEAVTTHHGARLRE